MKPVALRTVTVQVMSEPTRAGLELGEQLKVEADVGLPNTGRLTGEPARAAPEECVRLTEKVERMYVGALRVKVRVAPELVLVKEVMALQPD